MQNKKKWIIGIVAAVCVILIGAVAFSVVTASVTGLNTTYKKCAQQVNTLSAQANSVESAEAAWELLTQMEILDKEIDYLAEEAEWRGCWILNLQCDFLDEKLGFTKDKLEFQWRIDT